MTRNDGLQIEQLTDQRWVWIYQAPGGGFYRAPSGYRTRALARKAGREWLERHAQPRNRGR